MIVHKFGGTSLADAERIRRAAALVRTVEGPRAVVVSALAGVTSHLVELALEAVRGAETEVAWRLNALRVRHEEVAAELLADGPGFDAALARIGAIFDGLSAATEDAPEVEDPVLARRLGDRVTAAGEDLSAALMTAALQQDDLDAVPVDARDVVRTDDTFGAAVPLDEETARRVRQALEPLLEDGRVPVLQGFIGATADGVTTTLGRGGSDFTAAIVGAALGADEVCLWTDVDGVLSAEPGDVDGGAVLGELGYEEAVELAYFGARVVHPAAAKHAAARGVSLRVRNAMRPDAPGTVIRPDTRRAVGVAAVAHKPAVTLIKVRSRPMFMAYGFLARVFEVLARHRLPVDLVATSHTSTAFTIDAGAGVGPVEEELAGFAEVEIVPDLATVSVVGHGLLQEPDIAARVFSTLGDTPVRLISQASDVCLSFLVGAEAAPEVVRRLHAALIEPKGGSDT
ncbi:MAG: aspartate kinase [Gemmatimonadetes bacterium]|nr:aspartate kinase [Gemmatimonadota bacterium]NIQ51958.1 aspartate kinase [Gemmatimonadota bacterium]NIU72061.1 aspartate kinase [Gammaproteobacteria bacterium]NIX42621.1 aspartate kinase [Gemmatimonadota bacterium]